LNKLHNPDMRREACWLYEDLIMEAEFVQADTARNIVAQDTLNAAADLIKTLFNFTEEEMYFSVFTRKYRSCE
jgi:hypothetical protein